MVAADDENDKAAATGFNRVPGADERVVRGRRSVDPDVALERVDRASCGGIIAKWKGCEYSAGKHPHKKFSSRIVGLSGVPDCGCLHSSLSVACSRGSLLSADYKYPQMKFFSLLFQRSGRIRCRCASLGLAGWMAVPLVMANPAYFDLQVGFDWENNLGRAQASVDRLDDFVTVIGLSANQVRPLSARQGLLFTAITEFRHFADFDDLDQAKVGAKAVYRFKPDQGFESWWYELGVAGAVLQHADSDLRDGGELVLQGSLGRRFGESTLFRGGYRFQHQRSWCAAVFDHDVHRVFGNLDWRATKRATLYGTLGWQTGDASSTASPSPRIFSISTPASQIRH